MWGDASTAAWEAVALVAARVLPIALFSPACGGRSVPLLVRAGLGLVLALPVAMAVPAAPLAAPLWILLVKEVLIGAALALAVVLLFEAVAGAGSIIDAMAGRASPGVHATMDQPHDRPQDQPTRTLAFLFSLSAFFSLGGGRMLVRALVDSFSAAPPAAMLGDAAASGIFGVGTLALGAVFFKTVLLLAAPVLVVLLLSDLVLAVTSRLLAPMNGFFTGLTLKPLIAVLLCGLMLLTAIESRLPALGRTLSDTVRHLSPAAP